MLNHAKVRLISKADHRSKFALTT